MCIPTLRDCGYWFGGCYYNPACAFRHPVIMFLVELFHARGASGFLARAALYDHFRCQERFEGAKLQ
nr:hypothetical protein [Tanacetum cinerariifolium]